METITKPHFIILYQWEYFFVGNRIHTADNHKFFIVFKKLFTKLNQVLKIKEQRQTELKRVLQGFKKQLM